MTTSVTVKTHSWPVAVTRIENGNETAASPSKVEPNSEYTYTVWQGSSLKFEELPLPEVESA